MCAMMLKFLIWFIDISVLYLSKGEKLPDGKRNGCLGQSKAG